MYGSEICLYTINVTGHVYEAYGTHGSVGGACGATEAEQGKKNTDMSDTIQH
jgi:hypothetical protein